MLGCEDFAGRRRPSATGYVNRALPPHELGRSSTQLACRIASFPAEADRAGEAVGELGRPGVVDGLLDEAHCFNLTLATAAARERMADFLAGGGQTREMETGVGKLAALLTR